MYQPHKMLLIACRISAILLFSLLIKPTNFTFAQVHEGINSIAWSPDGSKIATGGSDGKVRIWDSVGQFIGVLDGHTAAVNGVVWNPVNSHQLASASSDFTIKVWNTDTMALITTLVGHEDMVVWADWSPDGTQIISVGLLENHIVRVWNTTTWEVESMPLMGNVMRISFSPDSNRLAIPAMVGTIGIVERDEGYNGAGLLLEGHTHMVMTVGWSPDGSKVASGGFDQTVRLWDALTGESLGVFTGHTDTVWQVAFSPDGNQIASASLDGSIRIWDSTTGENIHIIQADASLTSVAWSSDGTKLAYAETNDTIQIVDVAAFSQAGEIPAVVPVPESTAVP